MSDRPTPITDAFMLTAASGYPRQCCDFARDLERKLAEAKERAEQMGKLAHTNACEAMEYRSKLAEARVALKLIAGKNSMLRSYTAEEAASDAKKALARIDANASGMGLEELGPPPSNA